MAAHTAPTRSEVREFEHAQVASWRQDRFEQLGCSPKQAAKLADHEVDWHRFEDLLKAGCPVELAIAVLV